MWKPSRVKSNHATTTEPKTLACRRRLAKGSGGMALEPWWRSSTRRRRTQALASAGPGWRCGSSHSALRIGRQPGPVGGGSSQSACAEAKTRPRGHATVPNVRNHLKCSATRRGCFSQFGAESPPTAPGWLLVGVAMTHSFCLPARTRQTHTHRGGLAFAAVRRTLLTPSCVTQLT